MLKVLFLYSIFDLLSGWLILIFSNLSDNEIEKLADGPLKNLSQLKKLWVILRSVLDLFWDQCLFNPGLVSFVMLPNFWKSRAMLDWFYFCGIRQMTPRKVRIYTAWGFNLQSNACFSFNPYVWLLWYKIVWPPSQGWGLGLALRLSLMN